MADENEVVGGAEADTDTEEDIDEDDETGMDTPVMPDGTDDNTIPSNAPNGEAPDAV
ncbi:hypothetical protein H0W32_02520 [Patescibacteria group bacterium]|nr:hypothetical protein [Patescibacteria group bacterium]